MSKRVSTFRETCNNLLFLTVTVLAIIWLSVFSYGSFYYFYIPPVAHIRPVFLEFDTSCQTGICGFPSANVTLVQRGHDQLLTKGQQYKILLDLEMPESAVNRRLGMFMVKLSFFSQDGFLLKSSFRTSMLHYKSNLLRYLSTLMFSPFLLAGSWEEKQTITISLFENYKEHPELSAYIARVELHSRSIEIYSASLKIHAYFTGLRYYMYYWPILSAVVGISTNFYFLTLMAVLSWYRFLQWQHSQSVEILAVEDATTVSDEQPFTPVPLDLDSSADALPESEKHPEPLIKSIRWKRSKDKLAILPHSSVQELDLERSRSQETFTTWGAPNFFSSFP